MKQVPLGERGGKIKKWILLGLTLLIIISVLTACRSDSDQKSDGGGKNTQEKVVIGYFPNIDHAPAMVACEKGYFEKAFGDQVKVEHRIFPDGGTFMAALKSGEVDAGLVGPGPVINNYFSGADVRIIGGASIGGTVVVASKQSGISKLSDVAGKTFITPGIGCTHDVQFETSLEDQAVKKLTSSRIGGTLKHVTGNPANFKECSKQGK